MLKTASITDQVTSHLRDELRDRRWTGVMPGRNQLMEELGVSKSTIIRALAQLEKEGLLKSQGQGRPRQIVAAKQAEQSAMQLNLLLYENDDSYNNYILALRRELENQGHRFSFAPKTLMELKQDPKRVAEMVQADPGKAWIIMAGAPAVLEWFANADVPAFALFGRWLNLPIAGTGPDKRPVMRETLQQLLGLGHRRIVMLTRAERRHPDYGGIERVFLDELEANGIETGAYNIPDWQETPQGLDRCLTEWFQLTPPTAIFIADAALCYAVKNFLSLHRGADLRKVTLICTDYHPSFDWCMPPMPHFNWDIAPIIRRVIRWVNQTASGKQDRDQNLFEAKLVGGSELKAMVK